ncbi:MAG: 32, APCd [Verrucomicrobiaceae bacterium]|nr:32, APCd [Verrucomicrobiaceae bacterium]
MTPQFSLPLFEIRSQPQGRIDGYASVFGGVDSYGDTIAPGAYAQSLAAYRASGNAPAMLWSHQMDAPIGRWLALKEDARGLRVEGQLNLKTDAGVQAFEHLRAGDISGLSIGFRVAKGGSETVNGVNVLTEIDLMEISVVALPADSGARVTSVKQIQPIKPTTKRDLEKALHALGYSRREATQIVTRGFTDFDAFEALEAEKLANIVGALKSATKVFSN